jgi:hypothetical protein
MTEITNVDTRKFADELRRAADEIEAGDMIAMALITCDHEGNSGNCCMVDQHRATHELLDEMVYAAKQMMFDSFEDGK